MPAILPSNSVTFLTKALFFIILIGSQSTFAQRIHQDISRGAPELTNSEGMPLYQPFDLKETHPSHHTGVMAIEFDIAVEGHYVIEAVGAHGKTIQTIAKQDMVPGSYHYMWMVDPGAHGIYMYYLDDQGQQHFHRLLMIKY